MNVLRSELLILFADDIPGSTYTNSVQNAGVPQLAEDSLQVKTLAHGRRCRDSLGARVECTYKLRVSTGEKLLEEGLDLVVEFAYYRLRCLGVYYHSFFGPRDVLVVCVRGILGEKIQKRLQIG